MKKNEREGLQTCCRDSAVAVWLVLPAAAMLLLATLLSGCVQPKTTKIPTYEEARTQALKQGPFIQPPTEKRHNLNCKDKPVTLKKNPEKGIPFTGNLITNDKAECLVAVKAERDRLRKELDAERLRATTRKIINDAAYKNLAEQTKRSWWDRHGGSVLFAAGAAVGMAIVIGVLYAITGGKNVTVNSHVLPGSRF